MPLKVAIAEDSVLLREGLTRILTESGLEVIAAYDNADDLLNRLKVEPPDIALLDIRLPPTHTDEGMRAALQIRRDHPAVSVLVLSQYVELGLAMQLLSESAEGVGYLLKDRIGDVADFLDSIRRVAAGGSAIDPQIVSTLLNRRRSDSPMERLTPREREVLGLMAEGNSNAGHRRTARHHPTRRREVRLQRVRQAWHPLHGDGVPPGPGGAALPTLLTPSLGGTESGRARSPNRTLFTLLATLPTEGFPSRSKVRDHTCANPSAHPGHDPLRRVPGMAGYRLGRSALVPTSGRHVTMPLGAGQEPHPSSTSACNEPALKRRTSCGQPHPSATLPAHERADSSSGTSTMVSPPSHSLVSAKGPSVKTNSPLVASALAASSSSSTSPPA